MDQSPTLAQQKAALRALMIARRAAVADPAGDEAAEAVAHRFAREVELAAGAIVAAFWPLAGELDPRPLMRIAAERGLRLALPRMQGKGVPLVFHLWAPGTPLIPGPFKVMEPEPAAEVVLPDLVFAPLLAFDRAGRRLGYGAGFYDRTLAGLRAAHPGVLALGLAFAVQEVPEVPADASDEPLDGVLTERGLHWFERPRPDHLAAGAG